MSVSDVLDFEALTELEPRLLQLDSEVRSHADPGTGTFYCSNFVWLPLNAKLRALIGVARQEPGEEALLDSRNYERAYEHLSRQLPPCRNCGCRRFQPLRDQQLTP